MRSTLGKRREGVLQLYGRTPRRNAKPYTPMFHVGALWLVSPSNQSRLDVRALPVGRSAYSSLVLFPRLGNTRAGKCAATIHAYKARTARLSSRSFPKETRNHQSSVKNKACLLERRRHAQGISRTRHAIGSFLVSCL